MPVYRNNEKHCFNGGVPEIIDRIMFCRCLDEFTGNHCQVSLV